MNKLLHFRSRGNLISILRANQLSLDTKKLQGFTFTQRMQRELVRVVTTKIKRNKTTHESGMPF
jgi:phage antirepressor YoqD-like protein